ncbi:MAG: hypothetical protein KGJ62_08495 [Armatimonadetes bacterium]|nr:hypothetical protein [Armatimonadota bacterium]MDE2205070.1 hypothetical protein [Armatimonadota bacterium]
MIKRILPLALALSIVTAATWMAVHSWNPHQPDDPYRAANSWPPSLAQLKRMVGAVPRGPDVRPGIDNTHITFAHLFEDRYRNHSPRMAVGMRFMGPDRMRLMVPPRMEPWAVNRLAFTAFTQARAVFGTEYKVDIFENFIGSPPLKIGTLRAGDAQIRRLRIVYNYPPANREH